MVGKYGLFAVLAAVLIFGVADALPPQKIVEGTPATTSEFPYIVSLRFHGKHVCGGTIISERHIVTAAHCVVGLTKHPYTGFVVVTGSLSSRSGQTHAVKSIFYHDRYNVNSPSSPNDIAIISLVSEIRFDRNQNKLNLPTAATPSGVTATTAGWGLTRANGQGIAENLQKIQLQTLTAVQCQPYLARLSILYTHQVCAWTAPGQGPCLGDSGGPLVYNGQLAGVVSYSGPCAKGFPVVYSSVFHYVDWIKKIVKHT